MISFFLSRINGLMAGNNMVEKKTVVLSTKFEGLFQIKGTSDLYDH